MRADIKIYAAKRNGRAGQFLGVAFVIVGGQVIVDITGDGSDDGWFGTSFLDRHTRQELHQYFQERVDLGWFLLVDDPESEEALIWRSLCDETNEFPTEKVEYK